MSACKTHRQQRLDARQRHQRGTLANDSYNSSYDNAQEKSWQLRHDYNFAAVGVPGLTLMNRYISGSNVHTAPSLTVRNGVAKVNWATPCKVAVAEKPDRCAGAIQHAPRLQQQRV